MKFGDSFLCGRASRVEQFASGSSSRGQFTFSNADSNRNFFSLINDYIVLLGSGVCKEHFIFTVGRSVFA